MLHKLSHGSHQSLTGSLGAEEPISGWVWIVLPLYILVRPDEMLRRILVPSSEFTESATGNRVKEGTVC